MQNIRDGLSDGGPAERDLSVSDAKVRVRTSDQGFPAFAGDEAEPYGLL
jgi:hypothetical protein